MHEGEDDRELALVSGRVLAELEAEVEVKSLGDLFHMRLVDTAAQCAEMADDVAATEATELRQFSRHEPDQALDLDRLRHAVQAEDRCRSASRVDEAHEQPDGRALARAVGPEVAEHLPLGNVKVEVEEASPAAVVLGQSLGLD